MSDISVKMTKKDIVVKTAFRLFKENGFYATGVDLIMRESGVSKRTMYKYFRTKNELIVAVLDHYRSTYQEHMNSLLDSGNRTAKGDILAIFEDAKSWFYDSGFYGCLAVNAMGEFSGKDQKIENSCIHFKQWELGVLKNLCQKIPVEQPNELSYKLFVLLEGMSSIAQVTRGNNPVDMTVMAGQVIERHINQEKSASEKSTHQVEELS